MPIPSERQSVTQAKDAGRFQFEGFEMDFRNRTLHRDGRELPLRSKSFDVLASLIRNAGTLVNKDDLFDMVWPGIIASDESLSRCISDIRSVLNDTEKAIIRTVPGRGYQFTAGVAELPGNCGSTQAARRSTASRMDRSRVIWIFALMLAIAIGGFLWSTFPEKTGSTITRPSIAVLPFRNSTNDQQIEPFVTGLTSDLNTALARVPDMIVISENSTRQYRDTNVDIPQVAGAMGVSHILTGSVQLSEDQLRISVQLSEGEAGSAIWAKRYDRDLSHFLALQDDIVRNVLIGLQVKLTQGETARISSRGTNNLDAWLSNVEGIAEGFKFRPENNIKARTLFTTASQLDPQWAVPVSGQAWTYREALRRGWSDNADTDRDKWYQLARKCLDMDPQFSGCYIQLGNYYIESDQIDKGIALREKALELAPNDISALSGLAWQLILIGQVERGLELLQRAKIVSPIHPPWLIATEAYGYQVAGRFDKAIAGYQYALSRADFPDWHARLATVYVESGDIENARRQASLFTEKSPNRGVSDLTRVLRIQNLERTNRYADLLRKAGIPE